MNEQKTHYRKAFDSPYLSSADVVEPINLTIAKVTLESDRSNKTKDAFNTAHFKEKLINGFALKPMILNATNSKMLFGLTTSHFLEDWSGVRICVYVEHNIRFGKDTTDGLRLRAPNKEATPDEQAEYEALYELGKAAAAQGMTVLAAWFKGLQRPAKILASSFSEGLKVIAQQNDEAVIANTAKPADNSNIFTAIADVDPESYPEDSGGQNA